MVLPGSGREESHSMEIKAKRTPRHRYACLLLMAITAVLLSSCSKQNEESGKSTVVQTNSDPDVVTMKDPGRFALISVELRKVTDEVHSNCVITPDVNLSVPVVSMGSGRVVDIKVKLGDYVSKGQVLLLINSPDLSGAFSDYQKFKADEVLADKQLARANLLYSKGAIAQADLEAAQDAHDKATVDLQTAASHVKLLGGDINDPTSLLPLRAPISGTIVDQQITGGTGVRSLDNQQALFTIANLSQVWVVCDLYQDMLSRVHVGDTADITVDGLRPRSVSGKDHQHQPGDGSEYPHSQGAHRAAESQ